MSDDSDGDVQHKITREGKATFYNVYGLSGDGDLEVQEVEKRGPCELKGTFKCSCGRSFYKEERAAEHKRTAQEEGN